MNMTYAPYLESLNKFASRRRGYAYYEKAHHEQVTQDEVAKIAMIALLSAGLLALLIK